MVAATAVVFASLAGLAAAADPAGGWMAYAVGQVPAGVERITKLEMTWVVSGGTEDPIHGSAFYSPWFGMDPADNLNLIQPVNPWSGRGWSMYTEYFQWSPEDNRNSHQVPCKSGQTLHGSLDYMPLLDAYNLTQRVVETGAISTQIVKCQSGKKYTLPYVVYEKVFPCKMYPPEEKVTFTDIVAECDGKDCTSSIVWSPMVKDANCEMAAHIAAGGKEISITWSTSVASKYDNMTATELYDLNMHGAWAKNLESSGLLERPVERY